MRVEFRELSFLGLYCFTCLTPGVTPEEAIDLPHIDEIWVWCKENFGGHLESWCMVARNHTICFYMKNPAEAVEFKMRWL